MKYLLNGVAISEERAMTMMDAKGNSVVEHKEPSGHHCHDMFRLFSRVNFKRSVQKGWLSKRIGNFGARRAAWLADQAELRRVAKENLNKKEPA